MKLNNKNLRDNLLGIEKTNPELKQKYEREVKAMTERKLNLPIRFICALLGLVGIVFTSGLASWIPRRGPDGFMEFALLVTSGGATICAVILTILISLAAITGKIKANAYTRILATGSSLFLAFFLVVLFLFVFVFPWLIEHSDTEPIALVMIGTQTAIILFFAVLTLGAVLILKVLYRSEYHSRKKLLEIEYTLAEISEKIEDKQKST